MDSVIKMKIDFLIAGSPTDAFFSQIAFFRLCLNHLGGDYKHARLVATFGDHTEESIPERWQPYFENIDVVWAHPIGADNPMYKAQHYCRFEVMRSDADIVIICDADTALIRPFPELIEQCKHKPSIFGVIAHYHFPWPERGKMPETDWSELSQNITGKKIVLEHAYTLKPLGSPLDSPFYINYGFLAGTPSLLKRVYDRDIELQSKVAEYLGEYWGPQVSLALTLADLNLPRKALPMRYNFPNDRKADELYPEELQNAILIHYLRNNVFDRHKVFASQSGFQEFIEMNLEGSDRGFQKHVKKVTNEQYPFPY